MLIKYKYVSAMLGPCGAIWAKYAMQCRCSSLLDRVVVVVHCSGVEDMGPPAPRRTLDVGGNKEDTDGWEVSDGCLFFSFLPFFLFPCE